ncbi:TonB-dependent receptor plug domain-containing protein (plasmid) [Pedobacter sp. BS3]|nr:TonB-dependent receptor plug domain-containing protein [Pedobacter sp. BS3]
MIFAAEVPGRISGTISDKKTGETLIGVSVKIAGTTKGIATNVEGKFSLIGINPGTYTLEISYVGYATKRITGVEVKPGNVTPLNIILEESSDIRLNEVVVTASYKQESVNSLYAQQKNSGAITDGVSSELIKKSPDKNTSDVLKRVSGATIQDNKFVIVRGLSDRYNTAMLDNATLPSTEPNRKAFSFDIVPSGLVDNLVISKTATPDLPGDFTGGAVQIRTKDIPDNNFITVGAGVGYNTVSTFKDFQSGPRNTLNYFGFDNNSKSLSNNFPSRNQIVNGLTAVQNQAAIQSLPRDWNIYNHNALPSQNYQLTIGRVKDFDNGNKKLGAIVSLTYRNAQNTNANLERSFYDYKYTDNQYKFSTSLGALANFAYSFGNSKITFKNIYNKSFDDQFLYRSGVLRQNDEIRYYAFDLLEKSLFKSTIEGIHKVGDNNKLNWSLAYSNVLNNQPDQRKIGYQRNIASYQADPSTGFSANVTSPGKENARLFSRMNENNYSAGINYSTLVTMFSKSALLKFGLSSQYRDRDFSARFITLVLPVSTPDLNEIRLRPIETLFGEDLIERNVYQLNDIANLTDNYTANAFTNAAYAMLDNKIGEKLRVLWGVRAEQFSLNLTTPDPMQKAIEQHYLDILPSANFTYSLTARSNLRASYYRSLARPEFRELAPFIYYDFELLASQTGNPDLKRALIDNMDLRYEIYPSAGQILSVSAFYKNFNNAIEAYIDDANSLPNISYFNSEKANVYGLEFEIRKSLDFIAASNFLKNTTLYTNVSLVKSEVKNPNNPLLIEKNRPMVGQAPYVINGGLQHAFLQDKLTFNALYNRVGRRIFKAAGQLFPSMWEAPRNVIDLQLSLKVLRNKGEVKFNAGDILNEDNVLYWDKDNSKSYTGGADETISRYKSGSNYSLSFSYTF